MCPSESSNTFSYKKNPKKKLNTKTHRFKVPVNDISCVQMLERQQYLGDVKPVMWRTITIEGKRERERERV